MWPFSTMACWVSVIFIMYAKTPTCIVVTSAICIFMFFENMIVYMGFCVTWLWERWIDSNDKCYITKIGNFEFIILGLFAFCYSIGFFALSFIVYKSWSSKRRLKNQGTNLLKKTYKDVAKGKMTKEQIVEIIEKEEFKNMFKETPILPLEFDLFKKYYCVTMKKDQTEGGDVQECTICLDAYKKGDVLLVLPQCKHIFHYQCLSVWIEKFKTCPLCKENVRHKLMLTLGQKEGNQVLDDRDEEFKEFV